MRKVFFLLLCICYICAQAQSVQVIYKTQLEQIKRSEELKELHLRLKNYVEKGVIKNEQEVQTLKSRLLSESDSYFPLIGSKEDLSICSLQEIRKQKGEGEVNNITNSLAELIDNLIKTNMQVVELTWEYDGQTYKTLCVVSEAGIVYDNIILNIVPFEPKEKKTYSEIE